MLFSSQYVSLCSTTCHADDYRFCHVYKIVVRCPARLRVLSLLRNATASPLFNFYMVVFPWTEIRLGREADHQIHAIPRSRISETITPHLQEVKRHNFALYFLLY
jgi:hypothetical protein